MEVSLPVPSVGPQTENNGLYHFAHIHKSISKGIPGFHVPLPLLIASRENLFLAPDVSLWGCLMMFFSPVTVHPHPFQVGAINKSFLTPD